MALYIFTKWKEKTIFRLAHLTNGQKSRNLRALSMRRAVYIFAGNLLAAGSLFAQTNEVRSLTLQDCIRMALEHNFDVKIQRFNPTISRLNLAAAYGYYDPVLGGSIIHDSETREGSILQGTGLTTPPSTDENQALSLNLNGNTPWGMTYEVNPFRYGHINSTSGPRSSDFFYGAAGISISQPLLKDFLIDAGRQNILVSKKDLQITEAELNVVMMNTINRVEQAYYDVIFARENIKVQEKALELAERLLADNRKRVEVGTLAPLDEKQSESQVASSKADLIVAYAEHTTRQNILKNLFTDNYSEWHDRDIEPKEKLMIIPERFDIAESWQRGLAQRPDLQQLKIAVERRDIITRYQRNQTLPSVDLTGGVGDNGRDNALSGVIDDQTKWRSPFYSVGVIFSMPLGNRAARNNYKASKVLKEQAIERVKQLEQVIMVEIDNAIKTSRTNLERIESTRKAREFAELALDAEQKKLAAGKSTSFQVLQLQKDLTTARTEEIRALTDYNKTLSRIALAEGGSLDRHGLNMQVK